MIFSSISRQFLTVFRKANIQPASRNVVLAGLRFKNNDVPTVPDEVLCCGSGCQNCVWLEYAEKVLAYYGENYSESNEGIQKALAEVDKLKNDNLKSFLNFELRMKLK